MQRTLLRGFGACEFLRSGIKSAWRRGAAQPLAGSMVMRQSCGQDLECACVGCHAAEIVHVTHTAFAVKEAADCNKHACPYAADGTVYQNCQNAA